MLANIRILAPFLAISESLLGIFWDLVASFKIVGPMWKELAGNLHNISVNKLHCLVKANLNICVTAAVSGTEYSGELATSDLMVTFTFAAAIG